ncbi:MAG: hypothetical protein RJA34_3175 [Pseudomonadota bacterium]
MPPDLARALADFGPEVSPQQVRALFAPLQLKQSRVGKRCLKDVPYGAHERQVMDVYLPDESAKCGTSQILVYFHGGGFIRGDKQDMSNIGLWGAGQGYVTILANYRLAPGDRWPSGPEDVVAVCQAVQRLAPTWQADAAKLVLVGESAGAAHVAAASLIKRFQHANWHIAGAALLSGPYNAHLEGLARAALNIPTPDIRNDAYFGTDTGTWRSASVVEQINADPFPMLIAVAERDLLQMKVQAGELFSRLVVQHGFEPALHWWRHHNHFSPGCSIGTEDTSVSGVLATFIDSNCHP